MLDPHWGDAWSRPTEPAPVSRSRDGAQGGELRWCGRGPRLTAAPLNTGGSDITEAWPTERATTVRDLLETKRSGRFSFGDEPEYPPVLPYHNPAYPCIAPEPPAPQTGPGPSADPGPQPGDPRPPALPTHLCPPAHPPITSLFQWQVQQQLDKLRGVTPEALNLQDSDGDTALHIAVAQGRRALAYVLAANMALSGTLDLAERNGQTALHIAAASDQSLILCDLLEYGAQVHRRDTWGRSPLHVCVEKGHAHSLTSLLRTLKATRTNFNVDLVDYDGLSPLHVAVLAHNATLRDMSGLKSCSGGDMEALLKKGQSFLDCVKALLGAGAYPGAQDQKSGRTCLHMAAEEANTQLLRLFLNQTSSLNVVNQRTFSGNTALHVACALQSCGAQLEAVQILMSRGADPGARNSENELPCQLLPEGGSTETMLQVLKGRYLVL